MRSGELRSQRGHLHPGAFEPAEVVQLLGVLQLLAQIRQPLPVGRSRPRIERRARVPGL